MRKEKKENKRLGTEDRLQTMLQWKEPRLLLRSYMKSLNAEGIGEDRETSKR